jgi:hypothetical protein
MKDNINTSKEVLGQKALNHLPGSGRQHMTDWQEMVLEELKALNRKLERLDVKMDEEIEPLKKHVTQVRFGAFMVSALTPLFITLYKTFF